MPNYELKAEILEHNPQFVQYVKDENTLAWAKGHLWFDKPLQSEIIARCEYGSQCSDELFHLAPDIYEECVRIANADRARQKRLRRRIESMFNMGECVFITLTFNDDTLQRLSAETRREYVTIFLKSVSNCYVANIDFGAQNCREHYHAVFVKQSDNYDMWSQYGFYKAENVRKDALDVHRLAVYVSKLANHAIKNTTKRNAMIYSR